MKPFAECLEATQVELLLQGNLSPEEFTSVQDHFEVCESCRRRVESTIGPEQWWGDVQSVLLDSQGSSFSSSQDAAEDAEPHRIPNTKLLDLLGPTDDPNMLGRIGPYEIIGLLGQGGMGVVFKGFDRSLNRFVAIKMLLPQLAASGAARKRFAREAQAVAAVVDDHVMAIHCVDQWQGVPYLVMTYSRGVSLQKRLNGSGPLEVREILRIGMQAAKGLAAAHAQGIVHRDIKPANIFLDQTVERVQLMDFGLARAVDDASLTRTGVLAGTPQYMSPEQARAEAVDHLSDLFSLGSVMYAMCTGHAPFRAESSYGVLRLITDKEPRPIRDTNPDVPDWLCAIVSKLMAKQAGERFDTAKDVAGLLEECLAYVQQPAIAPLPKRIEQYTSNQYASSSYRKGLLIMLGTLGMFFMGMLLWSATEPPDISGEWVSDEWGIVELKPKEPGNYEGKLNMVPMNFGANHPHRNQWAGIACASCHQDCVGKIELKWSRLENRFNGNWNLPESHTGKLSVRLVDNEIRGGWTTRKKSDTYPGTPRLGDLVWKRSTKAPGAAEKADSEKSSEQIRRIEVDGKMVEVPEGVEWNEFAGSIRWLTEANSNAPVDPLAFAVNRFNEETKKKFPNHGQPQLTKEELVACASWNKLHKENTTRVNGLLTAIAHQHQLLDGWFLEGEYVTLPPADMPVRAFRISLKHRASGERFTIRLRFIAPMEGTQNTRTDAVEDLLPLATAIKRFNATHFRVDGKKQPPLTEEEVVASILHQRTRRDEYDVSDSLFDRLQDVARTRYLPKDAVIEVIPTFGAEGGTTHTIWSVRIRLTQDEAGREGWTYAFIIREHFVSVKHGDSDKIHWGTPGTNGLQLGVRLRPPRTRYLILQKINVEILYRNVLTKSIEATVPTFPSYSIEVIDENGMRRRVQESREHMETVAGAQVQWIGDQPISLQVRPIVLAPSSLGPDEEARLHAENRGANVVFVKPGLSYRLRFTASNVASGGADVLSSSEFEFVVDE